MLEREITPHPDEQRSYAELRAEFRIQRLMDLRAEYTSHHMGWCIVGDPALARPNFTAEEWARELDRRLCDPVSQDFGLVDNLPNICLNDLSKRLEKEAKAAMLHESVTWDDSVEGVSDHDAPPCDLAAMSDDQICDYVDAVIKESERE